MSKPRLLLFNLVTDADDPILGFATVWLNALAQRCEHIDVITMQAGRLDVASNVTVYSVGKEKGYSEACRAIEFYRILLPLLRHNHYDACFAHMMQLFAVMASPLLKARHIPITLWFAHKSTPITLQLAEKMVDHIVTASPESFRLKTPKLQVIGHGVDTTIFQPLPTARPVDRPFTIISVGRIAPVKRLETIIEAVKLLVENGLSDVKLRLVGNASAMDATYAEHLRELVKQYGLENVVEFPGGVVFSQIVREYQNADVMVNMSATGSIDKALLEAMACGLPVVTANEAFRDLLIQWKNTLLTTPDSPDELAALLKMLAEMTVQQRADLGKQLRMLVIEQHSLDKLVDKLMEILTPSAGG